MGNVLSDCDTKFKVKGQIMYFHVYASPPKPLDVATSNFAGALCHMSYDEEDTG